MKKTIINKEICGSVLLVLALTACKSTPLVDKPAVAEEKSPAVTTAKPVKPAEASPAQGSAIKEVVIDSNADQGNNPLKDPNNILSKRNVYFEFDSDAIKAEFRPLIEAHAKYLLANDDAKMVLQGNTDERGTREYNLALGQRRSVAVKKVLNLLGVKDGQIETVSYGEEKAAVNCANDACFQANRRAEIVYEGE